MASKAEVALRLWSGLLLLHLLLQGCVAIYDPDDDLDGVSTPSAFDDDEGAGVLTVHAGKKKPPSGSWGAPPPPPPPPPAPRDTDCLKKPRRNKRSAKAAKPMPVRIKLDQTKAKREASDYHCPDSWKELDFLEVKELECPDNATGWFPFPPDCRKYLNCWKGRGFLQACAPATLFHPIRRECDYPEKVKCLPNCRSGTPPGAENNIDGDPMDFADPDDPNAASPLIDVRSAAGPLRRVPPGHADATPPARAGRGRRQTFHSARLAGAGGVQCLMDGGTGLAAHPTDCTKFINCWQGKPHVQSCAPGTLFNPRFNACDHPHKVPECVNGKRDSSVATTVATTSRPASYQQGYTQSYTQGYTQGHQHGGYNQFGNQGYQPPPRQTFNRPGQDATDQAAAASSFQGYGPNQVAPPPGPKGKGLYPQLQPTPPSQNPGRDAAPSPDSEVEDFGVGSAGVIGPLPQGRPQPGQHGHHGHASGHSEDWHREHGMPTPPRDLPPGHSPAYHHHHHHSHQHQPGHNPQWHSDRGIPIPGGYTPQPGRYNPPQGGYTPQPGGYNPTQGGYNHHHGSYNPQQGAYTPQQGGRNPQQGSYNPQQGSYNPQQGRNPQPQGGYTPPPPPGGYTPSRDDYNPRPRPGGYTPSTPSDPQWHRDHGAPVPGGSRGNYAPPTTPSYPATTTCPPDTEDDDLDLDLDIRTSGVDLESGSSNWLTVLERTRNSSRPQSGQMVRIRGGPTPLEGYVEVMGPGSQWGSVCDKPSSWTVEEASIVCRTLGFERGAELAWQGRPRGAMGVLPVHVEEVLCTGQERSLVSCSMRSGDAGEGCNLETQAAGLRCFPNYAARCRPGEKPFKGSCYSLVVPRQDRKVDAIAFSQDEAIKHCKAQGGHLMDINSQAESDFVSEWLTASYPALGSVLTAGVGVSVPGRDVWVWEGTGAPFQFNLWWPGPPSKDFDSGKAPKVGERSLCVLLKKDFPCSSWPGAGGGAGGGGGAGYGNWQGARSCGAEYFYWHAEDCAIRQKSYPYVCERKADDVGCLGPSGTEYDGTANVSWIGQPCVSWDSPAAVSALRYRVSDEVRRATLSGHNHCRRVASGSSASSEPWCFVDAGNAGIKAERCDVPLCRENTGTFRGEADDLRPTPSLYDPNGRPRPPATPPPRFQPYPSAPAFSPPQGGSGSSSGSRDDPLADPVGTATAAGRPFPTLPTSRTFVRADDAAAGAAAEATTSWPDPFAGRGRSTTPSNRLGPRPGRSSKNPATTAPPPAGTTPATPATPASEDNWPVNYAPGFSHREVDTPPAPPSRDLLPPYDDNAPPTAATPAERPWPTLPTSRTFTPTTTPPPPPRDREEYEEDRDADYPYVPDPLSMPPVSAIVPRTGYGTRPDPQRGYGLPAGGAARPPVATARPPVELYRNLLLPGSDYAPYPNPQRGAGAGQPSYRDVFGLFPALALGYPGGDAGATDRYPDAALSYPLSVPGRSDPYSNVGYYPNRDRPAPRGSEEASRENSSPDSGESRDWPPTYNGHSGPAGGVAASRQSRTVEQAKQDTPTTNPPLQRPSGAPTTSPPFQRPSSAPGAPGAPGAPSAPSAEHVMKIPKPGEKREGGLQVTTEKIFFM